MGDLKGFEGLDDAPQAFGRPGRVVPRRPEDGPALEVDSGDLGDLQLPDRGRPPPAEPAEPVVAPQDPHPLVAGLNGGGGDHAVDPGGRSPSYQDGQGLHPAPVYRTSEPFPCVPTIFRSPIDAPDNISQPATRLPRPNLAPFHSDGRWHSLCSVERRWLTCRAGSLSALCSSPWSSPPPGRPPGPVPPRAG